MDKTFKHIWRSIIILAVFMQFVMSQEKSDLQKSQKKENFSSAEQLWEKVIEAKGGRKKLHEVNNLVVSFDGVGYALRFKRNQTREESFSAREESVYVFPNKLWQWKDARPYVFGLQVEMFNLETNRYYRVVDHGPEYDPVENPYREMELTEIQKQELISSMIYAHILYLLESNWMKPTLLGITEAREGLKKVTMIQIQFGQYQAHYVLDEKTLLPIKVSTYKQVNEQLKFQDEYELKDYKETNGVMMPQALKHNGNVQKQTYKINVEYNKNIFITTIKIEDGTEAWKPKTKM